MGSAGSNIGDLLKGVVGGAAAGGGHSYGGRNTFDQVEHLTKLVHIMWQHMERMEKVVRVIPEGLQIKAGMSEITVLNNGGVIIKGQRVLIDVPNGNGVFYTPGGKM